MDLCFQDLSYSLAAEKVINQHGLTAFLLHWQIKACDRQFIFHLDVKLFSLALAWKRLACKKAFLIWSCCTAKSFQLGDSAEIFSGAPEHDGPVFTIHVVSFFIKPVLQLSVYFELQSNYSKLLKL